MTLQSKPERSMFIVKEETSTKMDSNNSTRVILSALALTLMAALTPSGLFAQTVSSECGGVIAQNAQILEEFAAEGDEFGAEFAMQELTAPSQALASQQLGQIQAGDLTLGNYKAAYDRVNQEIQNVRSFDDSLDELNQCMNAVPDTGIDLLEQAEQQNECIADFGRSSAPDRIKQWLNKLAEQANLAEVMDRVQRAGNFLSDYTSRLTRAATDNATQAAQCLALADAATGSSPTETVDLSDPPDAPQETSPPTEVTSGGGYKLPILMGVIGGGALGGVAVARAASAAAQSDDADFCDVQRALTELNALNACLRNNFGRPEACNSEFTETRRFCNCGHDFAVSLGATFQNQCP